MEVLAGIGSSKILFRATLDPDRLHPADLVGYLGIQGGIKKGSFRPFLGS